MDLYIDRDELGRGLARIQGIIERRSTHPVLSHVLLHGRESGLRMTATDTEIAYIGELAANVTEGGELAVDAANLFQIVRALPEPTVHLKAEGAQRLEIRSGRAFFKLPAVPASEYPALPAFDSRGTARMGDRELLRLVKQVSFAVATEDVRWGLNGAHLEERTRDDERVLRMVATDGHRLSVAEAGFDGEMAFTPRMLVPRKALAVMKRLLEGGDGEVVLTFGEGALKLTQASQTFWFRLLDGEFPDYEAVVPSESQHRIRVSRDALGAALKRVSILVHDRARPVRFAFGTDELEIRVHNVDRGEVSETLPVELEGSPVTIGFNPRYLLDVLEVIDGQTVTLQLAHPLAPCLVRDQDASDAFFVVMPMRLD